MMTTTAFVPKPQLVYNSRSFSIPVLGDTGAQEFVIYQHCVGSTVAPELRCIR